MKIAITGHTKNLGASIFNHYKSLGHTVVGFSRSNGFNLPNNIDTIVEYVKDYDLFFNNAYAGQSQCILLEKLYDTIPIVTSGSIAATLAHKTQNQYFHDKLALENTHLRLKRRTNNPMLLLRMGYLNNFPNNFPTDFGEIIKAIDFWLENKKISLIEFENDCRIYAP